MIEINLNKHKYFLVFVFFLFQVIFIETNRIDTLLFNLQIDLIKTIFKEDKPVILLELLIFLGELILLIAYFQKKLTAFYTYCNIGLGILLATTFFLIMLSSKPIVSLITAIPFIIFSAFFVIRNWRKLSELKYYNNQR